MTSESALPEKMLMPKQDPSAVWKSPEVANTFSDIRYSVPLANEQLDLMVRVIRTFQPQEGPRNWLDLGCGDGPLSRKLLQEFPTSQGTMMDFSESMLETAGFSDRVNLVQGDLSKPNWKASFERNSIDVIVSGFTIHHLIDGRKQELYREIHDVLAPGGIFLNLEYVASRDPKVEGIFDGAFCDSMYDYYRGTKSREECARAVRYDLEVDDEANLVVPVEIQCDWLRQIGYNYIDCYFKFLIIALFGGVKKAL